MYNKSQHSFTCKINGKSDRLPYIIEPLVLNYYLTLECNMECKHCVARDMKKYYLGDNILSKETVNRIKKSPFLVVVITGGEPLLKKYESQLRSLIIGLHRKGIVIDTNGTIRPSKKLINLLRSKNTLLRISLDSLRFEDEKYCRVAASSKRTKELYKRKLKLIPELKSMGLNIAIQTLITGKNAVSVMQLPAKLAKWSIKQLYAQRLIPTSDFNPGPDSRFNLKHHQYEETLTKLENKCKTFGIECISKKDRRHNCVFLMTGDGELFTQDEIPGKKIELGLLGGISNYFEYVSAADHSIRYFEAGFHADRMP